MFIILMGIDRSAELLLYIKSVVLQVFMGTYRYIACTNTYMVTTSSSFGQLSGENICLDCRNYIGFWSFISTWFVLACRYIRGQQCQQSKWDDDLSSLYFLFLQQIILLEALPPHGATTLLQISHHNTIHFSVNKHSVIRKQLYDHFVHIHVYDVILMENQTPRIAHTRCHREHMVTYQDTIRTSNTHHP